MVLRLVHSYCNLVFLVVMTCASCGVRGAALSFLTAPCGCAGIAQELESRLGSTASALRAATQRVEELAAELQASRGRCAQLDSASQAAQASLVVRTAPCTCPALAPLHRLSLSRPLLHKPAHAMPPPYAAFSTTHPAGGIPISTVEMCLEPYMCVYSCPSPRASFGRPSRVTGRAGALRGSRIRHGRRPGGRRVPARPPGRGPGGAG
jgi:hypothetical protein